MIVIDSQNNFEYKYLEPKIELIFNEVEKEFNRGEISAGLTFVDNDFIKSINRDYRNKDKVTDVLSFEMWDEINPENSIGEVYVATDVAIKQAEEYGHSLEREILFLIAHGLLHLIGYDHLNEVDEKEMIKRQKEILERVGV